MDARTQWELIRVLRKIAAKPAPPENPGGNDRWKVILGFVATFAATAIGWYFTWTRDAHERLNKELALVQSVSQIGEFKVDRGDLAMAYLESLSDESIYRRVVGTLPAEVKREQLTKSIYRALNSRDHASLERVLKIISPHDVAPDALARYPLAVAALVGDVRSIRILMSSGYDPATELVGQGAMTSVMFAASRGNLDAVRLLVDNGADVNRQDARGMTALRHAADNGQIAVMKTLLARGADPNLRDNSAESPLVAVVSNARYGKSAGEVARVLLAAKANPNDFKSARPGSNLGTRVLTWSEIHDDLPTFRALLAAGANPMISDDTHIAELVVQDSRDEMFDVLESRKQLPHGPDRLGYTLLHVSSLSPHITRRLLEAGANPNAKSNSGETPVRFWFDFRRQSMPSDLPNLARRNEIAQIQSLRLVAAKGADVNHADNYGNTALCTALRSYSALSVAALLDAGAAPTTTCGSGTETVLALAVEACDADKVVLLRSAHPGLSYPKAGREATIKDWVDRCSADANGVDSLVLDDAGVASMAPHVRARINGAFDSVDGVRGY